MNNDKDYKCRKSYGEIRDINNILFQIIKKRIIPELFIGFQKTP